MDDPKHAQDWRELIDLERLADWMEGHGLGRGTITEPLLLTGGTQNVLVRFRRGEREFILRRPSRH
jgi:aminoglycoside phosphotransferase (APT) family kinase protein